MRWFIVFIFLVLGGIIGTLFNNSTGEVVFFYDSWQVQAPIWIVMFGLILSASVLALIIRFISKFQYWAASSKSYFEAKRLSKAHNATQKSLEFMILGDFDQASKLANKSTQLSCSLSVINALTAARTAHESNDLLKRDEIIAGLAKDNACRAYIYQIFLVKLKIQNNEYDTAHQILVNLSKNHHKNKEVLKLITLTSLKLGYFEYLEDLLLPIKKSKAFSQEMFVAMQVDFFSGYIKEVAKCHGGQELKALWERVPKHIKQKDTIMTQYIIALQMLRMDDTSGKIITRVFNKRYEPGFVAPFIANTKVDIEQKRKLLEKWLKTNSKDVILLEGLGQIYLEREIFGKSQSLFEQALAIRPSAKLYSLLGDLFAKKNDLGKAREYYEKGAKLGITKPLLSNDVVIEPLAS
ncbi:MAG: hypothetical protein HOI53_04680 [Francisellaceae bacterium]|jgi:HemY protein|nr:hypothetical protein [Francisellaceae bacterium]MBT6207299.1 hypothetical protein [Francisellaceae bacterium]MBT6538883.1 hypothetical protein [Francisellaceae bacterium]